MKIEKEQIGIIEFDAEHNGLSNSVLLEKIYTDKEVATKLKKSDIVYVYELMDKERPIITFVFNKGFMKGKVFCLLLTHTHEEGHWHTQYSEPFIKDGTEWTVGKYRTKAREEEFLNFIKSGDIWKV